METGNVEIEIFLLPAYYRISNPMNTNLRNIPVLRTFNLVFTVGSLSKP